MGESAHVAPAGAAGSLLLSGGTVLTVDAEFSRHEALGVVEGKIVAVGSRDEVRAALGTACTEVDLDGATVVPGFIETHTHPGALGERLSAGLDPSSPANGSIAEVVERVRAAVAAARPRAWVVGWGYDDTALRDLRHPTREDLDPVSPDHPVVLHHISGHYAVVNTRALETMGVAAGTPDPPGGHIHRDAGGVPTGVLAESAAHAVYGFLPPPSLEREAEVLSAAGAELARHGITTVHDAAMAFRGPQTIAAYVEAMRRGSFPQRVRAYVHHAALRHWGGAEATPASVQAAIPDGVDLRVVGTKLWADGSIQTETGYLAQGYACRPEHHGAPAMDLAELKAAVTSLDRRGWQVAIHANGDAAIEMVLAAYATLDRRVAALPHRIEHCQTVRDDQLDRIAELGLLPSFFAKHVRYWGDRHRDRFLGPARAARISPLASARRRGIRLALHSDAPITPVSPIEGIAIAVNRCTSGGAVLGDSERLDVVAALRAYTSDAAHFSGDDDAVGSLEPGKRADLAILSGDPTRVDPRRIEEIEVVATYVGGRKFCVS